mgnify:FL=1|jgi:hypothetical protein
MTSTERIILILEHQNSTSMVLGSPAMGFIVTMIMVMTVGKD